MKKNGFTLAEVLITLAIIGVVATLTLPALMANTQEQQAKTALKKGINTLTEAAQTNLAIAGFDYGSLKNTTDDDDAQSIFGLLRNRTNIDYKKSGSATDTPESTLVNDGADNYVIFFRDGSALAFPTDTMTREHVGAKESDGLVHGLGVIYDTNGEKGPNTMSNCEGNVTMSNNGANETATAKEQDGNDVNTVCTKANRVIKDQFAIRLREGYAVPNSTAARWAFEN